VLVVDENAASRSAIGEFLTAAGATVSLCGASRSRHEFGEAHRTGAAYDAILLDAKLRRDIGIELAGESRRADRERIILMLTSYDLSLASLTASEAEHRHLLKPIKRGELLDAVARITSKSQSGVREALREPRPPREENLEGLRILLAEDSEENRLLIGVYLRGTAHQLRHCREWANCSRDV
jgi:CheY-like chemotaxis protein